MPGALALRDTEKGLRCVQKFQRGAILYGRGLSLSLAAPDCRQGVGRGPGEGLPMMRTDTLQRALERPSDSSACHLSSGAREDERHRLAKLSQRWRQGIV